MGCDIHFYVEHNSGGSWSGVRFRLNRNYELFAWLADVRGVRGYHKPRGLPEDLSYTVFSDYYTYDEDGTVQRNNHNYEPDPDAHNMTWMTPEEFEVAVNNASQEDDRNYDYERAVIQYMNYLLSSGHEVRCVFWFDS